MDRTLQELVEKFYQIDSSAKALASEAKPLNLRIKEEMRAAGLTEVMVGSIKATYSIVESPSMNQSKLMRKIEALGLEDQVIEMVPQVNQAKIEDLIYNGVISAADLKDCMEVATSEKLIVKDTNKKRGGK